MDNRIILDRPALSAEPTKAFPGIWPAIGWIALYFAFQLMFSFGAIVVASVVAISGGMTQAEATAYLANPANVAAPLVYGMLVATLVTILLLFLYLRKGDRAANILLDRWSQIGWARTLIWSVGLIGTAMAFNYLYQTYVIPDIKVQEQLRLMFESVPKTAFNQFILLAFVAFMAPVVEELLFRGLLQRSLEHRMNVYVAILVSSLAFTLIHVDVSDKLYGAYAMPGLFILSIAFGFLYHKTGSLRTNIALHILNNAAALALS